MNNQEMDFYQELRVKVQEWLKSDEAKNNKWAEYLLYAPDLFHLLVKLSLDPDVPAMHKAKLLAAIAYFVSPFDILPEVVLGPIGLLDDVALASWVINTMINDTNPEILNRHWAGDGDSLEIMRKILASADEMIGSGLWEKIKAKIK